MRRLPRKLRGFPCIATGWVLFGLTLVGCADNQIHGTYGKRRGSGGASSVNGTAVLASMFEKAGHRVSSTRYLSPSLDKYDVVVWFPDDFNPPSGEQQQFLSNWLNGGEDRTLIYVGRDHDARITYWERIMPSVPPEQAVEAIRRRAAAKAGYERQRLAVPAEASCQWFEQERRSDVRLVGKSEDPPSTLRGEWAKQQVVKATEIDVQVRTRYKSAPTRSEQDREKILLAAGDDVLVQRIASRRRGGGQTLVVTNGSFLLNLPLVEHGHRKLAARLITQCGPDKRVAFVESGAGGPTIFDDEPGEGYPTGMEAFTVWPLGAILLHFIVLGMVYMMAKLMIFGRPNDLPPQPISDFSRHIQALGKLLERSQDEGFARRRIVEYQQRVKGETSASADKS